MRNDCVFAKCKNKIYIFYYFSFLIKLISLSPYKLILTTTLNGWCLFGALGGGGYSYLAYAKQAPFAA